MRMTETQREERTLRKSFSTFGACGPAILTADEVPDPATLQVRLSVNGDMRQEGSLSDLIVGVPDLIAWAASILPLEPGDLIATGSPPGVGPMLAGDSVAIESAPIGRLELAVREREW
jgi:2-keto-4-pentenoate hydratase/2-oxohepta-3-ene-1,7-dioic acid hydratase in catechol pathway